MAVGIYKTDTVEVKADRASALSVTEDEDTNGILCGMAVFELHPSKRWEDSLYIQAKVNDLCESLGLEPQVIPKRTMHLIMTWVMSHTTGKVYAYIIAFDGNKDHLIKFDNFDEGDGYGCKRQTCGNKD